MGGLSIWHWAIVLLVVVLIFGTKKLRNLGGDLGGAIKGFKDGMKEGTAEESKTGSEATAQVTNKSNEQANQDGQTIDVDAKEKR